MKESCGFRVPQARLCVSGEVLDNLFIMRPAGVTAIATLFFLAAAYLWAVGAVMLLLPGAASMTLGAPLLHGLELAGPFMFLLAGVAGALIGWGLLRLNNWARRVATVAAMVGVIMLVPSVSAAAVDFSWPLLWSGLGIIVRIAAVWYLWQPPVVDSFAKRR
ncbi:MAG: hypothetical protein WB562_05480 [Candidatus Sulfotelmatobacter sp.]